MMEFLKIANSKSLMRSVYHGLGTKLSTLKFHDFILAQGMLPPDLMRKAVMEDVVSSQR
jgi:hypothetical protein